MKQPKTPQVFELNRKTQRSKMILNSKVYGKKHPESIPLFFPNSLL